MRPGEVEDGEESSIGGEESSYAQSLLTRPADYPELTILIRTPFSPYQSVNHLSIPDHPSHHTKKNTLRWPTGFSPGFYHVLAIDKGTAAPHHGDFIQKLH